MKPLKSVALLDFQLVGTLERLRQELLADGDSDRLGKPLAYWALPTDRHLPRVFLGRTLDSILGCPLEELYATAGIGPKKIASLVMLFTRALRHEPPGIGQCAIDGTTVAAGEHDEGEAIDHEFVSEAMWARWRETVEQQRLDGELLGRFVPSLQLLPRTLWHTPLNAYTNLTLAELRQLKAHGEKRVRAVLETFGGLHRLFVRLGSHAHLGAWPAPAAVSRLEAWVRGQLTARRIPSLAELNHSFLTPLLEQVHVDAGDMTAQLVALRIKPQGPSMRDVAQKLGLPRTRAYEQLVEVGTICELRWPQGRLLAGALRQRLAAEPGEEGVLSWLDGLLSVFFPSDAVCETGDSREEFQHKALSRHNENGHGNERAKPHAGAVASHGTIHRHGSLAVKRAR